MRIWNQTYETLEWLQSFMQCLCFKSMIINCHDKCDELTHRDRAKSKQTQQPFLENTSHFYFVCNIITMYRACLQAQNDLRHNSSQWGQHKEWNSSFGQSADPACHNKAHPSYASLAKHTGGSCTEREVNSLATQAPSDRGMHIHTKHNLYSITLGSH